MFLAGLLRRVSKGAPPLAAALLLAGCVSVGHRFATAAVPELQIGVTTQAQVRELFGPPWRTGLEDGQRTWTYGYYRYALLGQPAAVDLVVRFDANGVVVSYTYSSTEEPPAS